MSVKSLDALQRLVRERGVNGFAQFIHETLTTEDTSLKMRPEDYSIGCIHEALVREGLTQPISSDRGELTWLS